MNAEQKQRAVDLIDVTKTYRLDAEECAMQMAALLQELVDAPAPEPFGYFKSEPFGWTDCAETDDGAIALYTAPSEPKPVARVTGYYAGYLSIATVDGRVLPAGTALYLALAAPAPAEPPEDVVRDAVAAEREACAKLCDEQHDRARTSTGASRANSCAVAIRARGEKGQS